EIVRIADATSLAGGYAQGLARATGEVVIFTHDDVEILATDFGDRLERRLRECDVLGVAGATRATAPGWPVAGWPYLHGSVIYPGDHGQGYYVTVYSRVVPLARGIRVMDGVFLAMRREVAASIGWDAETCDGFHGYDVDFTLRAAQAGLRLAGARGPGRGGRSSGDLQRRRGDGAQAQGQAPRAQRRARLRGWIRRACRAGRRARDGAGRQLGKDGRDGPDERLTHEAQLIEVQLPSGKRPEKIPYHGDAIVQRR